MNQELIRIVDGIAVHRFKNVRERDAIEFAKWSQQVFTQKHSISDELANQIVVMHEGRGELSTISQADSVHSHPALRERRASLERATQACEAVLRLLDSTEPNRPAYNLLCHELALLDSSAEAASRAQALAFRLKLLLAAGFAPDGFHLSASSSSARITPAMSAMN